MVLIQAINIKAESYFYEYYNNYINKKNNCESDKFIINLLKYRTKLLTFKFINNIELLDSLNKNNIYHLNTYKTLKNNDKQKCSICVENCDNNIVLKCLHCFCYKCINEYNYHTKKSLNHNKCTKYIDIKNTKQHIKCPICNKINYNHSISILLNKNIYDNKTINNNKNISYLHFFTRLVNFYIYSNNKLNKEFIYKYIGYKTYYILDLINKNKSPLNINKKQKKCNKHYKIIISYSNDWNKYMNNIINNNKQNYKQNYSQNLINNNISETQINFMYYETFIINFSNNFTKFINNIIYKKIKITFSFMEPRSLELNNELNTTINSIKLNMKHYNKLNKIKKIEYIQFKQFIIKNTIDEKIFKNKVIIYN